MPQLETPVFNASLREQWEKGVIVYSPAVTVFNLKPCNYSFFKETHRLGLITKLEGRRTFTILNRGFRHDKKMQKKLSDLLTNACIENSRENGVDVSDLQ